MPAPWGTQASSLRDKDVFSLAAAQPGTPGLLLASSKPSLFSATPRGPTEAPDAPSLEEKPHSCAKHLPPNDWARGTGGSAWGSLRVGPTCASREPVRPSGTPGCCRRAMGLQEKGCGRGPPKLGSSPGPAPGLELCDLLSHEGWDQWSP